MRKYKIKIYEKMKTSVGMFKLIFGIICVFAFIGAIIGLVINPSTIKSCNDLVFCNSLYYFLKWLIGVLLCSCLMIVGVFNIREGTESIRTGYTSEEYYCEKFDITTREIKREEVKKHS